MAKYSAEFIGSVLARYDNEKKIKERGARARTSRAFNVAESTIRRWEENAESAKNELITTELTDTIAQLRELKSGQLLGELQNFSRVCLAASDVVLATLLGRIEDMEDKELISLFGRLIVANGIAADKIHRLQDSAEGKKDDSDIDPKQQKWFDKIYPMTVHGGQQ